MNKKSLLLALPLVLASCSISTLPLNAEFDDAAYTNFSNFFNGTFKAYSAVTNNYDGTRYIVEDQVSSTAKTTIHYDATTLKKTYSTYIVSKRGYAYEQYLDIANELSTRSLSTGNLSFADHYGNPLVKVAGNASAVMENFTVSESDGLLEFKATPTCIEKATPAFNTFFEFFGDNYVWHSSSTKEYLSDLSITASSDGNPVSMKFTKIKKDAYGAISETYSSSLSSIEAVEGLMPYEYQGSAESYQALDDSLNLLAEKISSYNFAQTIENPIIESEEISATYHNYYDFDEYGGGAMLSDIPFYASGYGTTYIGIAYSYYYGGYYMAAVSPESDYYGAANSEDARPLAEVVPQILSMSKDFFSYDETSKTYTFNLASFTYDDYYFSFDILDFLFGTCDPLADKFGYYLADAVNYGFDFQKLDITIDETTGLPAFALTYKNYLGGTTIATSSFGSFGEIDLEKDEKLGYAYKLLCGE